jgi:hypothetical protein
MAGRSFRTISVTSHIQQSFFNRTASELRLIVEREVQLHQGQVQSVQNEVDEEIWGKGAQGWKLKRRTINKQVRRTDVS